MSSITFSTDRDSWVERSDLAVSLADPHLPDSPLTLVNPAFCRLTGYERRACVGRNCRFLQGRGTDPAAVARVREGIAARAFRLTVLRNYRADGTPFDNALLIGPLTDGADRLTRLFGMQWDLGATLRRRSDSDDGRLAANWRHTDIGRQIGNVEAMVGAVVESSRSLGGVALGSALVERLVALNRPQQYPPDERLPNWTLAGALVRYLLEPYEDGPAPAPTIDGDVSVLAADAAAPLGLAVHEFSRLTDRLALLTPPFEELNVTCASATLNGEPAVRLGWRARLASDVAPFERPDLQGVGVLEAVLGLIAGELEVTPLADGFEAVVQVPNRPYALGDGRSSV